MHTNASEMDARFSSASDLIKRAARSGDTGRRHHGSWRGAGVPRGLRRGEKTKIKLIPGMEGYLTDVTVVVRTATTGR